MKLNLYFISNRIKLYHANLNKSINHCCDRDCFRGFNNKNTKSSFSNLPLQIIELAAATEIVNL